MLALVDLTTATNNQEYRARVRAKKRALARQKKKEEQLVTLLQERRNRIITEGNLHLLDELHWAKRLEMSITRDKRWAERERQAARTSEDALWDVRLRRFTVRATPVWANHGVMLSLYREAKKLTEKTGFLHEINYIIPISDPFVCGLHCEHNLCIYSSSQK